jgi:hypothetical protein
MKKKVIANLVAGLVCLPCFLLLDGGPTAAYGYERIGWTNILGFVWMAFLTLGGFRLLLPKWMLDELSIYTEEEED